MRTRKEILEQHAHAYIDENDRLQRALLLEVLLDIRDLLDLETQRNLVIETHRNLVRDTRRPLKVK